MGKQSRDRARALREAQAAIAAQRGRRRRWAYAVGGVVIAALVVAIAVTVVDAMGRKPGGVATDADAAQRPSSATAAGSLTIGDPAAPVELEVFLDYMCPFCGRFERANGDDVARLVAQGTVRLQLYPLSFLDEASAGSEYSTRAANAVATVADRAPEQLLAFHQALFEQQPAEGTEGLSDDAIAALARDVGVPAAVVATFDDRRFVSWTAAATEQAFASGISGTPTVRIDGTTFTGDLYTAGTLTRALTAAAAGPQ
ncbi:MULTISPECIES: DsbA family protein [unclassified Solwaraspora]|uniref:DsbA family protein n=1 Tax=unclassified Solwaraspora TaxID=2627926 RepID=UPI00259BACDC|nr:thioredoxin domain-containing protein [Solwaraspora sp. WMMA2056]WJK38688.1 thioredoxin domain-containing protein [Solwaraspora sp. WMMA2056]